ncbi:MAG: response regulator [Pseudomonadota bacterium]
MNTIKILLVDDNDHILDIFKEFFESKGDITEAAKNGREGVDKYRTLRPDIVLMDMQMPVMNGYESSKGIKNLDPNAKILMVTGHPNDPLAEKSLLEGYVTTIVPKPFNLNSLFQMVHSLAA